MSTKKPNDERKNKCDKKTDSLRKELNKLKGEINKLKQKAKEKDNKLLRNYADLQNYQKRTEKESQYKENETKKKYLSELIELKELLKKAYKDKDPKTGLQLMLNNLENFFEKEQIKYIDCVGKIFDHNIHHAVTAIEKNDCEDGTILEEIKKGYFIDDKLLRPSQVIVAVAKKK
jgi:molecular chaperone GrpE